jgi:hypothetical protein
MKVTTLAILLTGLLMVATSAVSRADYVGNGFFYDSSGGVYSDADYNHDGAVTPDELYDYALEAGADEPSAVLFAYDSGTFLINGQAAWSTTIEEYDHRDDANGPSGD